MRTLGLFYHALGKGGIERGASFQIPMFAALGWKIVVFTNEGVAESDYENKTEFHHICLGPYEGDAAARRRLVAAAVQANGIDLVVHHDAYVPDSVKADLEGARDSGARTVVFWHSVFTHFLLRRGRQLETQVLWEACRSADAMVTLTKTDETFFRIYGIPSIAIPYADPDLMEGFVRQEWPKRMIWMGRFVELKRPFDPLVIAERVLTVHPDAELILLGEGDPTISARMRSYVAARPQLAAAVRFEGFKNDVRPYLEQAGVGLVTSRFEGYCHAIVEMKMASLPVVSYEMPWLDTIRQGTGAETVAQGSVSAAADAVCRLFSEPETMAREGLAARKSYRTITGLNQRLAYEAFFNQVLSGELGPLLSPDASHLASMTATLIAHSDTALRLMKEERDRFWQGNRSYRLGRLISLPWRWSRQMLHGLMLKEGKSPA